MLVYDMTYGKHCQFGKGSIWEILVLDTGNAVSLAIFLQYRFDRSNAKAEAKPRWVVLAPVRAAEAKPGWAVLAHVRELL